MGNYKSPLAEKCKKYGLDPDTSSTHDLVCTAHGLNPKETSTMELARVMFGLPRDVTYEQVEEAVQRSKTSRGMPGLRGLSGIYDLDNMS